MKYFLYLTYKANLVGERSIKMKAGGLFEIISYLFKNNIFKETSVNRKQ